MEITSAHPVIFDSQIEGIPCKIKVTWYIPAVPAQGMDGPWEDSSPMETSEFEFEAIGEHKFETDYLNGCITQETEDRIFNEFEAYLLACKYDKDF